MTSTLIIGAGPAGYTAAYELSKLGLASTILEADTRVGGISRTVNHKGYRFDIGGHRFFSKIPLINEMWQEILGNDFLTRNRLSRIYYRQNFFDYPLKALNALSGLGPVEAGLVMLSYAKARISSKQEETNFEQWVSNRFGSRLYEIFFKTYTEKVWGIPCTELSADWAAQRIKNLSLPEALRNALLGTGRSKDGEIITSLIETFRYPRLGPGMMWERCEELLSKGGNETIRNIKVEKIRHHRGKVEAVYGKTGSGELQEFGAEHIVSTMPLRSLIRALDPLPPDQVLAAANDLRYRDYLTVALIVERESVFADNWVYIHSPDVKVGRIQNYKNWSPEMVPDASKTSLGLEYFLWDKDDMWSWSDDHLTGVGIDECARLGLIEPAEVTDGTVIRMKKAYPVYDRKYGENLAIVRSYLETISNLQTIGRNGLHRYNNQDHSMLTGVYAARNIAGEHHDVWAVNTENEYHEEGRQSHSTSGDRLVPVPLATNLAEGELLPERILEEVLTRVDAIAFGLALGLVSGFALFLATVILLLKGGEQVGPNLSLLSNYLVGFQVNWRGALIGFFEVGGLGFCLGSTAACFWNWGMDAYAYMVRQLEIDADV
jgi:protoporphyrinogen oxidase